jgi:hypothetical protein
MPAQPAYLLLNSLQIFLFRHVTLLDDLVQDLAELVEADVVTEGD